MGQDGSILKNGFTSKEIQRLEKRFHKLDLDQSGTISIAELMDSILELKDNPLVKRVVEIFDKDNSGEIDFKGDLLA